jgi:hypothetical protein
LTTGPVPTGPRVRPITTGPGPAPTHAARPVRYRPCSVPPVAEKHDGPRYRSGSGSVQSLLTHMIPWTNSAAGIFPGSKRYLWENFSRQNPGERKIFGRHQSHEQKFPGPPNSGAPEFFPDGTGLNQKYFCPDKCRSQNISEMAGPSHKTPRPRAHLPAPANDGNQQKHEHFSDVKLPLSDVRLIAKTGVLFILPY